LVSLTALLHLQEAVKALLNWLQTLDENGKLKRSLTNSHLRPRIEVLNAAVAAELRIVIVENTEKDKNLQVSTFPRPTVQIYDEEAQAMWQKEFGLLVSRSFHQ
jgi:hypothetical protein